MRRTELTFQATESKGRVSGILLRPDDAFCLYLFAHGAGAGMEHSFMDAAAVGLAERGVATLRYNFPYKEAGRGGPNPAKVLVATVRSAVAEAGRRADGLPMFAGGKSMGGRMTSTAASEGELPGVRGIAFYGFPLHAPGRDSAERGAHLADVGLPMLFLQGTRDKLANLDLLRPLLEEVEPTPKLHVVEGADHGFHVLKRSGRTELEVMDELADTLSTWAHGLL
ncbi:MAG: alpha/beta hydrolase [Gemmatimonadetes bacterium]|nr:alpha/beta hydrolase [Gemmatimonadota bacterium]NNL30528.1 alpha/beta hydrolase [Gemmatimonadota bacterium]